MENKHIEYLANEYLKRSDSYDPQTIRQFIKDRTIKYFDSSEALSALQALETALTEKHRAEVENPSQYDVNQLQQLINEAGDTHVEVHAFQLEGALDYINQLRTKNKRLRDYAQHKSNCDMGRLSMSVGVCTCGLDQLLTTNPHRGKEEL